MKTPNKIKMPPLYLEQTSQQNPIPNSARTVFNQSLTERRASKKLNGLELTMNPHTSPKNADLNNPTPGPLLHNSCVTEGQEEVVYTPKLGSVTFPT